MTTLTSPNRTLAARVREQRQAHGLTQYDLADRAQVSERLVWDIEAGRTGTYSDTLAKLADVLGASMDYLYGRVEEPEGLVKPQTSSGL